MYLYQYIFRPDHFALKQNNNNVYYVFINSPVVTSELSKIGRIYFIAREMGIRIKYRYMYTVAVNFRTALAGSVGITFGSIPFHLSRATR